MKHDQHYSESYFESSRKGEGAVPYLHDVCIIYESQSNDTGVECDNVTKLSRKPGDRQFRRRFYNPETVHQNSRRFLRSFGLKV